MSGGSERARRAISHSVLMRNELLTIPLLLASVSASAEDWTHLARGADRVALIGSLKADLTAPIWVASVDAEGESIDFVGASSPVATDVRAFAVGTSGTQAHVYAFSARDGIVAWQQPIEAPVLDSWSSPVLHTPTRTVIVASGVEIAAFDSQTGVPRWSTELPCEVVNASPAVTTDILGRNRLFITEHFPFGGFGRLFSVNLSPYIPGINPYQPGEIVWETVVGSLAGATPAYADGVVYVATVDDGFFGPGEIFAYPADVDEEPEPLWVYSHIATEGFAGGVAVAGGDVYAATYDFYGGFQNSTLVKLDASSGVLRWSTPSNRTDAIPVPMGDGRVLLSGGIDGFGSVPSVQLVFDTGSAVVPIWDTALDTWDDLDGDGAIDADEYLRIGGWNNQPFCVRSSASGDSVYVGVLAEGGDPDSAYTHLLELSLAAYPDGPTFVTQMYEGAGSSPVVAGRTLYSIGPTGLHAFRTSCPVDVNGDGALNTGDLIHMLNHPADYNPRGERSGNDPQPDDWDSFLREFERGCVP